MKRPIVRMMLLVLCTMPMGSGCAGPDGTAVVAPSTESSTPDAAPASPTAEASRAPSIMGDVIFPHEQHAFDLEIACEVCHHEINANKLVTPHPEYFKDFWINCDVCHNGTPAGGSGPEACSNCHQSHLGDVADQTQSAKVVVHRLCWSCHEAGTGLEASNSCQQCHTGAQGRS